MFENPQYSKDGNMIHCKHNGQDMSIPVNEENADYQEIMRLVDAGELTIAEPDA